MTSVTKTRWGTLDIDLQQIDIVLEKASVSQQGVVSHPLYDLLTSIENVRVFMEHHVFAVLDFMWLLKRLQRDLTSVDQYWRPVGDPETRRFINEIVVGEESDDIDGEVTSHFEFYLRAMDTAGADSSKIRRLIELLVEGEELADALAQCGASQAASRFMLTTSHWVSDAPIHATAGAFAFGREKLIPEMFVTLRHFAGTSDSTGPLLAYLDRHIDLDGDEHTPLAFAMVTSLCGNDTNKWEEVAVAARRSIDARQRLWDDVVATLDGTADDTCRKQPSSDEAGQTVGRHLLANRVSSRDQIIATTGFGDSLVDRLLNEAIARGHVMTRHNTGQPVGFSLTERGREEWLVDLPDTMAEDLIVPGHTPALDRLYEEFLPLNVRVKECCTSWQIRDRSTLELNDHSDPTYDHAVLSELSSIHQEAATLVDRMAAIVPGYARFGERLAGAKANLEAGDIQWFTSPAIDSYHTVWFELHEDLLQTLGRRREDEDDLDGG